jgi:hypothetical protein
MEPEIKEPIVVEPIIIDPIAAKDAEITKLKEDRDNYKNVALKRLGKLPNDGQFIDPAATENGLTVEEIVKQTLLDREIAKIEQEKQADIVKILKENSELKIALKNAPHAPLGGESGAASVEVKDNVLSDTQTQQLTLMANKLKVEPEKFIADFKKNLRR